MSVRIIAGQYRGMVLDAPSVARPTLSRCRQSLFDILESVGKSICNGSFFSERVVLDAFAGSGALGIESMSRGAKFAYFIDNNKEAVSVIKANAAKILKPDMYSVIFASLLFCKNTSGAFCDIVFLDPPYSMPEIQQNNGVNSQKKTSCRDFLDMQTIVLSLQSNKWINDSTIIIAEEPKARESTINFPVRLLSSKCIGNASFSVFQVKALY